MIAGAAARREALRELLKSGRGTTQEELCRHLLAEGYAATQSTVSRDLKLLGARRVARDDGRRTYHLRPPRPSRFPTEMILDVAHNEAMVVVRTRVGRAQAVGLELDALRDAGILGTLAGDDTVLVVPCSVHDTAALAARLRALATG